MDGFPQLSTLTAKQNGIPPGTRTRRDDATQIPTHAWIVGGRTRWHRWYKSASATFMQLRYCYAGVEGKLNRFDCLLSIAFIFFEILSSRLFMDFFKQNVRNFTKSLVLKSLLGGSAHIFIVYFSLRGTWNCFSDMLLLLTHTTANDQQLLWQGPPTPPWLPEQ